MAAETIQVLTEIPKYPTRKDPQDRYDTLIKAAVDGGSTMVNEINTKFIPNYNEALPALNSFLDNKDIYLAVPGKAAEAVAAAATATADATTASASAATATTKAAEAAASASTASTKADEVAVAAPAAVSSAASAETSASTATAKASEASASAEEAVASAQTAVTKATEASASASAASVSAAAAQTAQAGAEQARDEAQAIVGGNVVPETRTITAGTGLTGGGDLSADRTLAVNYGTAAGTACQGNDARLTNSRTPTAHASTHNAGGSDPLILFFSGMITPYYGSLDETGKYPLINGIANTSWHICDGTDGTPDMRDRVPLGASTTKGKGTTGGQETVSPTLSSTSVSVSGTVGATTLSIDQMPSHSHSIQGSAQIFDTGYIPGIYLGNDKTNTSTTGGSGSHTHTFSESSSSHTHTISGGISTLQPYVSLHFIMYIGA